MLSFNYRVYNTARNGYRTIAVTNDDEQPFFDVEDPESCDAKFGVGVRLGSWSPDYLATCPQAVGSMPMSVTFDSRDRGMRGRVKSWFCDQPRSFIYTKPTWTQRSALVSYKGSRKGTFWIESARELIATFQTDGVWINDQHDDAEQPLLFGCDSEGNVWETPPHGLVHLTDDLIDELVAEMREIDKTTHITIADDRAFDTRVDFSHEIVTDAAALREYALRQLHEDAACIAANGAHGYKLHKAARTAGRFARLGALTFEEATAALSQALADGGGEDEPDQIPRGLRYGHHSAFYTMQGIPGLSSQAKGV